MHSPPFLIVVAAAWIVAVGVAALMWLSRADVSFQPQFVMPVALCLILSLVFAVGPRVEARKAKDGIARIVGAAREDGSISIAP
jgi:hypothetical protein